MLMAKSKHVKEFAEDVRSLFRDRVDRIMLYGSYARDEEVPGSDVDIAVILERKEKDDRKKVQELAEEWMQETDLRFSARVFEKDDFEKKVKEGYSFHTNVQEEGVEI
ncbi:MAG: nucleotidyltransferase domain-containing protein [Candidatus Aenigmatarchaeota archaeon]